MSTSRRQFLQISAATVGLGAVGSGLTTNLWGMSPDVTHDPATEGDKVVPSFCELCFWNCGILAHVRDGRLTKIEGNPDHPLSRGHLCPRGTGGAGLLYDPDRLQTPLMRVEARGAQKFEAVSWETALDHIAERLLKLREQHGPEALAMFSHGYGASWFKTLMKAYGTGNVAHPSYAQCRGARTEAFALTFGDDVGAPERLDIEHTRVLTLIGSHLGENMHNTQVQDLARAIENGAELIVVDPRFSTAAGKARYWLPIRPGTDLALLLAWMHVIVGEGLYDRDYIAQHAIGLEQLTLHLADKTPQWAFVHTGIQPEQIVETARFMAGARPASLVHPGRRAAWNGQDTQRGRAMAMLNALLGSWGRKGGIFTASSVPLPKVEHHYAHPSAYPAAPDAPRGTVYPFASDVLAHGLRDASIPGADVAYPIRGWLVYGTNLMQALPDRARTIAALQALDFMVAIDVLPSEITGWADVVLPEATYLERFDDLHAPGWREPFAAIRQPVVAPLHQSKPGWWIAAELGRRMGMADTFPWKDVEEYLDLRLHQMGTSLAEMKTQGVLHGEPAPLYFEDGVVPSFPTPSGKIELYSQQMADAGLPPMPEFYPPAPLAAGEFHLLTGRAPMHTFGRTTNNRLLSQVFNENVLWMNARVARERGLRAGALVTLATVDGARSQPIKLKPTQRIRPDCLYMVHGYGHHAERLTFANARGASDNDLINQPKVDPAMGATALCATIVTLDEKLA